MTIVPYQAAGKILKDVEPQEPSIFTSITNNALSGLGAAGHILDTPGGIVRGLLNAAFNDGDIGRAFTGIVDWDTKVSGNELIGRKADEFSWGGLGIELLTDPTSYLTFGAKTAVGQLAKRAGKLDTVLDAQKTLLDLGVDAARKNVDQSSKALELVEGKLVASGVDAKTRLGKTIKEQFAGKQRALVQVDIPFTNIAKTLVDGGKAAQHIGTGADMIATAVTQNPVAKEIHERFITTMKNPVLEQFRQAARSIEHKGKFSALAEGKSLAAERAKLSAVDEFDLRIVKLLEEHGDALKLADDGPNAMKYVEQKQTARVAVEELYGETDQFDEVWAFAQRIRSLNEQLLKAELDAGVPVGQLDELGYFSRVITPEGATLIKENDKGRKILKAHMDKLDAGGTQGFQRARHFKQLGLSDLNKKLAEAYGKDVDAFKFFDEDVISVSVNRMISSAKAVSRARFAQAVVSKFGDSGVLKTIEGKGNKVKTVLAAGDNQVGLEKLIHPRGPFVAATRFKVNYSAEKMLDATKNLVRRGGIIEDGATPNSLKIMGYEISDEALSSKVVEQLHTYVNAPARFAKLSKGHDVLQQRFDDFVDVGIMTKGQAGYLRAITANMDGKFFENMNIQSYTPEQLEILNRNLGSKVFDRGTTGLGGKVFGQGPIETAIRSYAGADTPFAAISTNLRGRVGSLANTKNPSFIFLHELGHALHKGIFSLDPASAAKGLEDEASTLSRNLLVSLASVDMKSDVSNLLKNLGVEPQNFTRTPDEMFATSFALWQMGHRVGDKTLEKAFREVSGVHKAFRDTTFLRMMNDPADRAEAVFAEGVDDLSGLFNHMDRGNADKIAGLPPQQRTAFLSEHAEEPYTRSDWIELAPDATEKTIRREFKLKGVEEKYIDKDILSDVEKFLGRSKYHLDGDKWWHKTIRTMDEIHGIYRTTLTQYFPAFHARNLISNTFMNMMAGDVRPQHYWKAKQMLAEMGTEEALELASLGVIDSGKMREVFEYMSETSGGISASMKNTLGRFKPLAKIGKSTETFMRENVGNYIENHTRLAHYIAKKDAGLTDLEAADSVIKYLFDYTDLTDFEKAIPRRGMLFYTFMRKNLPLMVEKTFTDPRFMLTYSRATGQTNANIPQPEWLPDSFFFTKDEKGNQIRLNFGLPPEDLARFDPENKGLARVAQLMLNNLAPAFKEPMQFISGTDFFTGRAREGSPMELLEGALPTARATGTIRSLAGSDDKAKLGQNLVALGTGIRGRDINQRMQKDLDRLNRIRDRLQEIVREGGGREINIVGNRKGQDNPEIRELNSMQATLQSRLSKMLDEQGKQ